MARTTRKRSVGPPATAAFERRIGTPRDYEISLVSAIPSSFFKAHAKEGTSSAGRAVAPRLRGEGWSGPTNYGTRRRASLHFSQKYFARNRHLRRLGFRST